MHAVEATRDFYAIGQLAAHLQRSVRQIERAAAALGLLPSMRLNGVPYYDGAQVEQLTAELRRDDRA